MGNIECFGDRDDEYIDEEGDTEMVMLLNGEEVPVSEYNEETDKNNAIFMFRVGSATLAKRAVSEEKFKSEVQTITDDSWVLPERTKSVVYKDSRQINLERLKSYFNDDSSSEVLDSRLNYTSTYSGSYFISVEGFKNRYSGSYSINVELLSTTMIS